MSKNRINTKKEYADLFKILFISIFFQIDKFHVVKELNNSEKLRNDYGFSDELIIEKLNNLFSMLDEEDIRNYVVKILNQRFKIKKEK